MLIYLKQGKEGLELTPGLTGFENLRRIKTVHLYRHFGFTLSGTSVCQGNMMAMSSMVPSIDLLIEGATSHSKQGL